MLLLLALVGCLMSLLLFIQPCTPKTETTVSDRLTDQQRYFQCYRIPRKTQPPSPRYPILVRDFAHRHREFVQHTPNRLSEKKLVLTELRHRRGETRRTQGPKTTTVCEFSAFLDGLDIIRDFSARSLMSTTEPPHPPRNRQLKQNLLLCTAASLSLAGILSNGSGSVAGTRCKPIFFSVL